MSLSSFTVPVLADYRVAALKNADSLMNEAELLLSHDHYARAYFLSVAAIEETGKAAILFQAAGRNLKASDVQSRLRFELQDHSSKITNAFVASLKSLNEEQLRKSLTKILEYVVALKHGREPAMYSDLNEEFQILLPESSVRPLAATDCLKLARGCFASTSSMVRTEAPAITTRDQDKMWTLGAKAQKVWKEDDFGEFLLDYIEQNGAEGDIISPAVTAYYDQYFTKGKKFKL